MVTAREIADTVLGFGDAEYFGSDVAPFRARQIDLLDQPYEGLSLNAPPMVAAGATTIPLALAIRETGHRAWRVARDSNTCLVALDLDRREIFAGPAFVDPKLAEFPPAGLSRGPEPTGTNASSISSGIFRIDARQLLDLPRRAARYRFGVIAQDWISNLVEVRVAGDETPPAAGREPFPPPAEPDDEGPVFPTYRAPATETPDAEDNPFDDAGEQTEAQLRLPVFDANLGPDPARGLAMGLVGRCVVGGDPALHAAEGASTSEGPLAAVVPMTVLFFTTDVPRPSRADLALPSHGPIPAPGELLSASFALDLAPLTRPTLPSSSVCAYVALEGVLVGPIDLETPA